MIGAIVPYVSKIRRSYQSNDLIDRLNYQYTAMLVALGAITLAATQYVGKPIQMDKRVIRGIYLYEFKLGTTAKEADEKINAAFGQGCSTIRTAYRWYQKFRNGDESLEEHEDLSCWVPAQFTGAWEKYAETYCFIKGSYFLPDDEHPNEDFIERDNAVIGYYQWVPLMLALQAFLFYAPCLIWKALNCSTGINVKDVLENTAKVKKNVTVKERENQVFKAAVHLQEALELQRELKSEAGVYSKMRKSGFYLSSVYVFTKFLYVLNIIVQFCIFSAFLGTNNAFWGWDIFTDIWSGREWNVTGHFPRVTMCDFTVRVLGALHRWTVQCVLMINMFTEKIYVFLWFWFILVGVLSVISLLYWVVALVGGNFQRGFVMKYLRCMGEVSDEPTRTEEEKVGGFVRNYLTSDGVFLLRLIQTNGGDILAGEIIASMFRQYNDRRKAPMSDDSFGDSPDTTATLPR